MRKKAKRCETSDCKYLIVNGKYYLPPPRDGSDLKELFKHLASAGAGRPVDKDGFPQGSWTPDLLAEAITQIDTTGFGIELRTVQLWFQDNDKGIGTDNIRWLARILGCDDPEATSEWQVELSAARSRLVVKRREKQTTKGSDSREPLDLARSATVDVETETSVEIAQHANAKGRKQRFSLARSSESLFCGSPLSLPSSIFAVAVALCYTSYFLGIHDIMFVSPEGPIKQVGFLWAPNWTIVFMAIMPLFFGIVAELLVYWKNDGRMKLVAQGDREDSSDAWTRNVEASSYTFWANFLICSLFVGVFQWVSIRLLPLMHDNGDYATDWGRIANKHTEIITVPEAVAFTGFAYLYMCICFYLFFVGLILLYTIVQDLSVILTASNHQQEADHQPKVNDVSIKVMRGIFRCTILGILVAMCMKLQSTYMASSGTNIVGWLVSDMTSTFSAGDEILNVADYIAPNHFSSFLIVLATCFVFLYGLYRLGIGSSMFFYWPKMSAVVALLVTSYTLIGAFTGFSILLIVGVLLAIYGLFHSGFGIGQLSEQGDKPYVS